MSVKEITKADLDQARAEHEEDVDRWTEYGRRELLDVEDLNSLSITYEARGGVYFLFDDREVVYVGMVSPSSSSGFMSRVGSHRRKQRWDWNGYLFIPVEGSKRDVCFVENEYIKKYDPRYNKKTDGSLDNLDNHVLLLSDTDSPRHATFRSIPHWSQD